MLRPKLGNLQALKHLKTEEDHVKFYGKSVAFHEAVSTQKGT
jgi:hypothetical protein